MSNFDLSTEKIGTPCPKCNKIGLTSKVYIGSTVISFKEQTEFGVAEIIADVFYCSNDHVFYL